MPPYRVLQDEWSDYDDDSDVEVHEGKDESRDGLSPPDSSTPARHSLQKSPRGRSPQEVAIKEEWVELSDTDGEIETEPVQQETIEVLHDDTRAVYRNVVSQSKGKSLSQPLEQVMSISTQNTVSQRPQAVFSPALRGVSARSSHDTVSRQITKSYEEHAQVYRVGHPTSVIDVR